MFDASAKFWLPEMRRMSRKQSSEVGSREPTAGLREEARLTGARGASGASADLSKACYKNVMLLAKVARRGRHDGPLAKKNLAIRLQRLTHIVFTHELGRLLR
jgi:hypothetical protein